MEEKGRMDKLVKEKLDAFTEAMNMRAGANISYHIRHMKKPLFMMIGNSGDDYIAIIIETLSIYLSNEQAIKLHEVIERSLYGKTHKELEAKIEELQERLSYCEDILEYGD